MIDVNDADIVRERRTDGGRWLLFTRTDLPPRCPIGWWGVTASTGGDGYGFLVRLDDSYATEGWTALDLLTVVAARAAAELDRRHGPLADEIHWRLQRARHTEAERCRRDVRSSQVLFAAGSVPSPYPWTIASLGPFALPLCPDPVGRDEGITLEQLLIVIDTLLTDAALVLLRPHRLIDAQKQVAFALTAETHRLAIVRAAADRAGLPQT